MDDSVETSGIVCAMYRIAPFALRTEKNMPPANLESKPASIMAEA